jgi:thioesterase domain-containing protein
MDYPYIEVEFTKDGDVFQAAQADQALATIANGPVTDLFVVSHGWNNDIADARQLYENLVKKISEIPSTGLVGGLDGRSFAVLGVFWPSKKFTDEELIPGGGVSTASPQNVAAVLKLLEELKNDPARLGAVTVDPARSATLDRAKTLVPKLETDPAARHEFVEALRSVVDRRDAHAEDGSDAFFQKDPLVLFSELSETVVAPSATGGGGAAAVGGGGGAAGLSDLFGGIIGAARRLANFTTYYQMKTRAGTVGTRGLAPLLKRIRAAKPALKIHLIGHSFGGRLVTAAAAALDPNTAAVTMTLLQAAYSHNGLSARFDGTNAGFFRAVVGDRRISGPILITHTKNDKAVGVAYPLASRIANDKAAAFGDANDPYGGMGRNGAQHTTEVAGSPSRLLDLGEIPDTPYRLTAGSIYNLNSDRFIGGHSDICNHQVACAILAVVATT